MRSVRGSAATGETRVALGRLETDDVEDARDAPFLRRFSRSRLEGKDIRENSTGRATVQEHVRTQDQQRASD